MTGMALGSQNYSYLPADTSLSPAFSITVSVVATTTFPPAGRVRRYIILAMGLVCRGPQLLPGLLRWTCAQLLLGPEPRTFSRDLESPGSWCVVWTSLSHKTMLGLHETWWLMAALNLISSKMLVLQPAAPSQTTCQMAAFSLWKSRCAFTWSPSPLVDIQVWTPRY